MDSVGGDLKLIAQDITPCCPNLAIYLLAAVLRENGYMVEVIDLTAKGTNRIDDNLQPLREAELISISATSLNWPTVLNVIKQIRAAGLKTPIVLGGIHPTMFPDYIIRSFQVDFVIRSEGEKALVMLCKALEGKVRYKDVPNLSWHRDDGLIIHNPVGPLLTEEELANLPPPAFDLLPLKAYPALAIQSSRGCGFSCSFCSTMYRRSYRAIPPETFVDLIEKILALGGDRVLMPDTIQIVDDEWSLDRKRTIAILKELDHRGLKVRFVYDSRANDFLDEDYVAAVAPHTSRFLLGAECGYNEGLARTGKGTTIEKIEKCAGLLQKYGIAKDTEVSFILGLPWESKDDVLRTVRFASQLVYKYGINVLLQWYCQIPGSILWDESYQRGEVTQAMYDDFGFFRNLYLFRTGVQLSPEEIWEVMDVIRTIHSLIVLFGRNKSSMLYRSPGPIDAHYPLPIMESKREGVANLLISGSKLPELESNCPKRDCKIFKTERT
jgi:radical SAM superfamily enzyme YgiQ (UPF0313 family)